MHRDSRRQNQDLRKLRKQLEESLNKYRELIEKLETAVERHDRIKRDPGLDAGPERDELSGID